MHLTMTPDVRDRRHGFVVLMASRNVRRQPSNEQIHQAVSPLLLDRPAEHRAAVSNRSANSGRGRVWNRVCVRQAWYSSPPVTGADSRRK